MFSKVESVRDDDRLSVSPGNFSQEDVAQLGELFQVYYRKIQSLDQHGPESGEAPGELPGDMASPLSPQYLICLQGAAELVTRRRSIEELAYSFLALFQKSFGCIGGCFLFQFSRGWRAFTPRTGNANSLNYPHYFQQMILREMDAPSWDLKQTAAFPIAGFASDNGRAATGSLVIAPARVPNSSPAFFLLHFAEAPDNLPVIMLQMCGMIAGQAGIAIQLSQLDRELSQMKNHTRLLEEQLLKTVKMAAITEVAGGIAHEINNPLQVIMGRVQLARLGKSPDQHFELIEKQTLKIADLVRGLQSLTQKDSGTDREMVDLRAILNEILALIQGQFHKRSIQIHLEMDPNIPCYWGDRVYVQQILLNFLFNARKRIGQKGTVTISVKMREKKQILFEISDSGPTLSKDAIKKLTNPFKDAVSPPAADLDIGLLAAVEMIRAINGFVEVETEERKGNRIAFVLPL